MLSFPRLGKAATCFRNYLDTAFRSVTPHAVYANLLGGCCADKPFKISDGIEDVIKRQWSRVAKSSHDLHGLAQDPIADSAVNAVSRHNVYFNAEPIR
jgi:hypothetical protein